MDDTERKPALADVRRQVRKVTEGLESLRLQLMGIQVVLPEARAEALNLADVEDLDAATEIRTVIDCVLRDWLGPAIVDLEDVLVETRGGQGFEGAGE